MFGAMLTKHGPRLQREGLKKRIGSETTAPVQWGAPRKTATVRGAVGQTDFSRSHFGSGLAHVWASGRRNVPPDPSGNDVAMGEGRDRRVQCHKGHSNNLTAWYYHCPGSSIGHFVTWMPWVTAHGSALTTGKCAAKGDEHRDR